MKKYNLSNIMREAWNLRKTSLKWINPLSFAECLRRAWSNAKEAIRVAKAIKNECYKTIDGVVLCLRPGVIACAGRMGWNVYGKTYGVRRELRRMGFRWDCESQNWYTEDANVAKLFA